MLDDNLFFTPPSEQPTSPDAVNTKNSSSSMITVRSTAEKTKGKQAAEAAHEDAELWARYVVDVIVVRQCVLRKHVLVMIM